MRIRADLRQCCGSIRKAGFDFANQAQRTFAFADADSMVTAILAGSTAATRTSPGQRCRKDDHVRRPLLWLLLAGLAIALLFLILHHEEGRFRVIGGLGVATHHDEVGLGLTRGGADHRELRTPLVALRQSAGDQRGEALHAQECGWFWGGISTISPRISSTRRPSKAPCSAIARYWARVVIPIPTRRT